MGLLEDLPVAVIYAPDGVGPDISIIPIPPFLRSVADATQDADEFIANGKIRQGVFV